jgi:hypothetical protein
VCLALFLSASVRDKRGKYDGMDARNGDEGMLICRLSIHCQGEKIGHLNRSETCAVGRCHVWGLKLKVPNSASLMQLRRPADLMNLSSMNLGRMEEGWLTTYFELAGDGNC